MNYFQRSNIIIWTLAALLIITLSALGTMVFHRYFSGDTKRSERPCGPRCAFLTEELDLSESQEQRIEAIRNGFRAEGRVIADSLQLIRSGLVTELSREDPDTLHLNQLALQIGHLQALLTQKNSAHYLDIKKELTPEQREKLSSIYYELMGCCNYGEGKRMRERCQR